MIKENKNVKIYSLFIKADIRKALPVLSGRDIILRMLWHGLVGDPRHAHLCTA